MSNYNFEIKEIDNGWILHRKPYGDGEYFATLNELCQELLEYVDSDCPFHRSTGAKNNPQNALKSHTS